MPIPLVTYQNDAYYFFINIGEVKQNLDALMYLDKGGIIIPSKMKKIAFFFFFLIQNLPPFSLLLL